MSWGYHWRRPVTYLHSCDHLLFRICFQSQLLISAISACVWRPAKPRTGQTVPIWTSSCTVFAIWHLRRLFLYSIIWIFACAPQSNIQLWWHGPSLETSGKGFRFTSLLTLFYMVILLNTSWRITVQDGQLEYGNSRLCYLINSQKNRLGNILNLL